MPVEDLQFDSEQNNRELKEAIDNLAKVVGELIEIFKTANADIHAESDNNIGSKLDTLISQNQEIAKAILILIEIEGEHLPKISRQVEKPKRMPFPEPMPRIAPSISPKTNSPQSVSPPVRFVEMNDDEKSVMRND